MPGLGDTFLVGDGSHPSHLWIIITTPRGPDGEFLIVNMTTLTEHKEDRSCVLDAGDHPFVRHKTVIAYHDARTGTQAALREHSGMVHPREPVSAAILSRIQQGALKSAFLRPKFRAMIELELHGAR